MNELIVAYLFTKCHINKNECLFKKLSIDENE